MATNLAYSLIPYVKKQDVIRITRPDSRINFAVSIIDGYNDLKRFDNYEPGRKIARLVADKFPKLFLDSTIEDFGKRANETSQLIEKKFTGSYPYPACSGAFIFDYNDKDVITVIGSVYVYLWNGKKWYKPREIGDHSLDLKIYQSDVSRFFGAKKVKEQDPIFSVNADTVVVFPKQPIFIGTDGIEEVLSLGDLNTYAKIMKKTISGDVIGRLEKLIKKRHDRQNDDVAIFLKI